MEVKLMMSGVPKGESVLAPDDEKIFLSTLYSSSSVNYRFDIKLRTIHNINYVYYQYLVYNIVNDVDGRSGAYFGLTLRMDSYCSDFRSVYNALDMAFRKNVVGTLLKELNGGLRYVCYSFDKSEDLLISMEKDILSILGIVLSKTDIAPIKKIPGFYSVANINFADANDILILNCLGQGKTCSISFEYDSESTKKSIKEAFEKGVQSRQNEINSLSDQLITSQNKIKELEPKNKISIKHQPLLIQQPEHHDEYNHNEDEGNGSKMTKYVGGAFVLILALVIGIYFVFFNSSGNNEYIENTNTNEQNYVFSANTPIDDLIASNGVGDSSICIVTEGVNNDTIEYDKEYTINVKAENKIDSICIKGGTLSKHEDDTYSFKAADNTSSVDLVCLEVKDQSLTVLQKKHFELKR